MSSIRQDLMVVVFITVLVMMTFAGGFMTGHVITKEHKIKQIEEKICTMSMLLDMILEELPDSVKQKILDCPEER